jgi:hypothetical protein
MREPKLYRCTAVALFPPPEGAPPGTEPSPALCELVEGHEREHADQWSDEDELGRSIWLLWDDTSARGALVEWCETEDPNNHEVVCTLFRGHPDLHSWSFTDPTMDALRAEVDREMASGRLRRDNLDQYLEEEEPDAPDEG